MRKITLLLIIFTISTIYTARAQVAVNTDGSAANSSAMLDIKSDTAGILIPRMTLVQRNLINNPAEGLMVFQTDETAGFYYYDGLAWAEVSKRTSILSILESMQNGVTDVMGTQYETVLVGNQLWMAENLTTTKYNDGTDIPLVTDNTAWTALSTPGYCWYDNDEATYGGTYGALYNWYTVNTGILCPAGWHVPTEDEWTILTTYVGGENTAGDKLKEAGVAHWNSPNAGATNEYNYTALPGGMRFSFNGEFSSNANYGSFWSSSDDGGGGRYRAMYYSASYVTSAAYNKGYGFSVRCLKDN